MSPGTDERRPHDEAAPSVEHPTDADHSARCALCGRVLTATSSVQLGIGPKCRDNRTGGAA